MLGLNVKKSWGCPGITASRSGGADLAKLPPNVIPDGGESEGCGLVLPCGHRGSHPCTSCHALMADAIRRGDVSTLAWLYEEGHGPPAEYALIAAAEHGQVDCVKYVAHRLQFSENYSRQRGACPAAFGEPLVGVAASQWVPGVCNHLAERGNLTALQTLVNGGCGAFMDHTTIFAAAKSGSKECVEYLTHLPLESNTFGPAFLLFVCVSLAFASGSLGALELLFHASQEKYDTKADSGHNLWDFTDLTSAADNGHLNCVEFAVAHGCPWRPRTTEGAAKHGHADILKFAVSQGVRLTKADAVCAIVGHSLECLKIALDTSGSDKWLEELLVFAATLGYLQEVRYLHERGAALWVDGDPIDAEGLRQMREDLPSRMRLVRERLPHLRVPAGPFDPVKEIEARSFSCPRGNWRQVAAASAAAASHPGDAPASSELGAEERGPDYRAILRYSACKGARLTLRGTELLRQQRECTRAALRGFARAGRLGANGVGLPNDVVHSILLVAGLEIEESLGYTPEVQA